MNNHLATDPSITVYDYLNGYSNVSGSSIIQTTSFDVVLIRSPADLVGTFSILSSVSFCIMCFLLFFYHKLLKFIQHIIHSFMCKED